MTETAIGLFPVHAMCIESGLTSHLISLLEVCMCQILVTIRIFTDKGFLQIRASYQGLIYKKPLSVNIALR